MTLTEAWKESYKAYLNEVESSIDSVPEEITEMNAEILKGFDYIEEYFKLLPVEGETLTEDDKDKDGKNEINPADITSFLMKQLGTQIMGNQERERDLPGYKQVEGFATVERLSDMKFPKNIIFFIQQLIQWIKRVVVYFIERIKNVVRALVGAPKKELDSDALKLRFERAKKLEMINSLRPTADGKTEIVRAIAIDPADVKEYRALREEAINEGFFSDAIRDVIVKSKNDERVTEKPVVISIDLSKDLLTLKQLIQHFYDLYDNAFGSNNEELFKTDDLETLLGLFKRTVEGIKSGRVDTVEIGTNAVEVSAIDAARIKDNVLRTNTNVEALKGAYLQTSNRVKDVARIITHKELLMLSGYGVDTKWLSSSTYQQMMDIMNSLKPRLKDAEADEKKLNKLQKQYEEVAGQLLVMQRAFNAFSNITYTSVYQRRVIDLCNSARYMTQVVSCRLSGLALYIKEMKDIRDLIIALANINKGDKKK